MLKHKEKDVNGKLLAVYTVCLSKVKNTNHERIMVKIILVIHASFSFLIIVLVYLNIICLPAFISSATNN